MATKKTVNLLKAHEFTGFHLVPVEVTTSETYWELAAKQASPEFIPLKVDGQPGGDDLGLKLFNRPMNCFGDGALRDYATLLSDL